MMWGWPGLQASIPSIMLAPYPAAMAGWSDPQLDSNYDAAKAGTSHAAAAAAVECR